MKIKIKIKTLLLLIVIFAITYIWAIPTATLSIANYLEKKNSDKAFLFFEKYASYPTTSNIKGGYLYANNLIEGFSKYTIFFNGWGGGEDTSPENITKTKSLLEDVMKENPNNESEKEYYIDSYKMLLDLAIATGDVELLHKWISFGQNTKEEKIIYTADIYNAFLLHVNGDRESAEKIIEIYDNQYPTDTMFDILKAEIAIFDENYEEAERLYDNVNKTHWQLREKSPFGSGRYYDRSFWFERVMNDFKGDNKIRGTVTYEGKPMAFVQIYVQEADGGFSSGGENYIGITDENGKFETLGLKDGVYNIGIGVDGSLLTNKLLQRSNYKQFELNGEDGEIHFVFNNTLKVKTPVHGDKISGDEFTVSWDEVEGAKYYTVEPVIFSEPYGKSGSSFRSPVMDKNGETQFTDTSATFSIESLKEQPSGLTFEGEEMLLGPHAILGLFLPGVEYPIVVNVYDENYSLITSSLPLRTYYDEVPSITVEGKLTEGENLILQKKYPEAIEFYENKLKDNPKDLESLRYLTKIYGIGWKKGEKNLERAIELGLRYTDITKSNKLFYEILKDMELGEIRENKDLVYATLMEEMENMDESGYRLLSRYYIAIENWEGAREALQKFESYVPDNLFYLNMYFGNYMEAIGNIQSQTFYNAKMSTIKIKDALTALENSPPQFSDKQIFNDFLLKLTNGIHHEEGKKLYDEAVKQIKNINIKTILHEIYLERNWD